FRGLAFQRSSIHGTLRSKTKRVKRARRQENAVESLASRLRTARLDGPVTVFAPIESLSLEQVFGCRGSRWFLVTRRLLEFLGGSRVLRPTTGGERRGHQAGGHAEHP